MGEYSEYSIVFKDGTREKVVGYPCKRLNEKYPDLDFFVAVYPCPIIENCTKTDCMGKEFSNCCRYQICDVKTGIACGKPVVTETIAAILVENFIEENGIGVIKETLKKCQKELESEGLE